MLIFLTVAWCAVALPAYNSGGGKYLQEGERKRKGKERGTEKSGKADTGPAAKVYIAHLNILYLLLFFPTQIIAEF